MKLTQKKKALLFDKIYELVLSGEIEILEKPEADDEDEDVRDFVSIHSEHCLNLFIEQLLTVIHD
jgi:hypothetical protein